MALVALITLSACDAESRAKRDRELDAVANCQIALKKSLLAPESFANPKLPRYSEASSGIGSVRGDYSASNAFGAQLAGAYSCEFDHPSKSVIYLRVDGPLGSKTIIEQSSSSAARSEALRAGSERSAKARVANQRGAGADAPESSQWIVNMPFSACPVASDWFGMQDAVEAGDFAVELPSTCFKVLPGTLVVALPEDVRPARSYKGRDYEMGQFENGQAFYTDSMDGVTMSPAP